MSDEPSLTEAEYCQLKSLILAQIQRLQKSEAKLIKRQSHNTLSIVSTAVRDEMREMARLATKLDFLMAGKEE